LEDTRVSILGVAAERLPIYLSIFTLFVVCVFVWAAAERWDSIEQITLRFFELLKEHTSGLIAVLIAGEGVVMGLNEIRTRQKIADAVKAERQRIQEERLAGRLEERAEIIRILEQAGKRDSAQLLRDHTGNGTVQ
jgi:hypothetical protein